MYAYTYNFAPEPFTLFILRWNGRFLHLHQNICNNHCNTATKAYHTRNQRTMVADHLQRAMVIWHTTLTDVADGFNASATGTHWFSGVRTSVADVYVILDDKTKTPYYMSWRTSKCVKGDSSTRQGAFTNSSSVWGIIFETILFFLFLF